MELLLENLRTQITQAMENTARSLMMAASASRRETWRLVNEYRNAAARWRADRETVLQLLGEGSLSMDRLQEILSLLPPGDVSLRYHLERLTASYDELCLASGEAVADLFSQGEAACDRGDHDIGINVLHAVIERDPRFFPARIVLGWTYLVSRKDTENALKHFERAYANIPLRDSTHFQGLALVLIAHTQEAAGNYSSAITTLKRLKNLGLDSTDIYYRLSRDCFTADQFAQAVTYLETALEDRSDYLACAIVDQGFLAGRKTLTGLLDEKTELWGERATEAMHRLKLVSDMARLYQPEVADPELEVYIDRVAKLEERVSKQGCYSVYRHALLSEIPDLVHSFPDHLARTLNGIIAQRKKEADAYNRELEKEITRRRFVVLRIAVPAWLLFSLLIGGVLAGSDNAWMGSTMVTIAVMLLGLIPFSLFNRRLEHTLALERRGVENRETLQQDLTELEALRGDLMSRLIQR